MRRFANCRHCLHVVDAKCQCAHGIYRRTWNILRTSKASKEAPKGCRAAVGPSLCAAVRGTCGPLSYAVKVRHGPILPLPPRRPLGVLHCVAPCALPNGCAHCHSLCRHDNENGPIQRLGNELPGPRRLDLEFLNMLTTLHRNALTGPRRRWWCPFCRRLHGRQSDGAPATPGRTMVGGGEGGGGWGCTLRSSQPWGWGASAGRLGAASFGADVSGNVSNSVQASGLRSTAASRRASEAGPRTLVSPGRGRRGTRAGP